MMQSATAYPTQTMNQHSFKRAESSHTPTLGGQQNLLHNSLN